ncbi:MAG: DUF4255 domain-containing protein [Verrucomicrobia bacterium]|nr:DUF4255 domain-containing protein [Verrucomicrobiota bacterium]
MLDVTLQFLRDQLNTYLLTRTGSDSVKVKLSKVVDEAGKYAFEQETIGASVVNIEEERTVKTHLPEYTYVNGQHVAREPELKLNLYVMFAANFKVYDEALKYISHILAFFQTYPAFTADEFPLLDPRLEKLTLELQSPTYEQLNQIWAFLGGKQLPSILYKARLIVIEADAPATVQPPLTKIGTVIQSR